MSSDNTRYVVAINSLRWRYLREWNSVDKTEHKIKRFREHKIKRFSWTVVAEMAGMANSAGYSYKVVRVDKVTTDEELRMDEDTLCFDELESCYILPTTNDKEYGGEVDDWIDD